MKLELLGRSSQEDFSTYLKRGNSCSLRQETSYWDLSIAQVFTMPSTIPAYRGRADTVSYYPSSVEINVGLPALVLWSCVGAAGACDRS